jgi:K(+)-stimulated pyrophosphate-energized sodium pump
VRWSTGWSPASIIGRSTEYYTSASLQADPSIARAAEGGAATTIIAGIGVGMLST